jgi:hypothetical protein
MAMASRSSERAFHQQASIFLASRGNQQAKRGTSKQQCYLRYFSFQFQSSRLLSFVFLKFPCRTRGNLIFLIMRQKALSSYGGTVQCVRSVHHELFSNLFYSYDETRTKPHKINREPSLHSRILNVELPSKRQLNFKLNS